MLIHAPLAAGAVSWRPSAWGCPDVFDQGAFSAKARSRKELLGVASRVGAKSVSAHPVGNDVMHSMQNLAMERFLALQLGQMSAMSQRSGGRARRPRARIFRACVRIRQAADESVGGEVLRMAVGHGPRVTDGRAFAACINSRETQKVTFYRISPTGRAPAGTCRASLGPTYRQSWVASAPVPKSRRVSRAIGVDHPPMALFFACLRRLSPVNAPACSCPHRPSWRKRRPASGRTGAPRWR